MSMFHYIVGFGILFGVLVFLHEVGHFLSAKGMRFGVEVFSLGFGPRLIGFRRGETDYRISLIPLGGYVRIRGMEREADTGDARAFYNRPLWQQFVVLVSGGVINILLGVVFFTLAYLIGFSMPKYLLQPPRVAWVFPDSPADEAGLQVGDRIVRVGDQPVSTWQETLNAVSARLQPRLRLTVTRRNERRHLILHGRLNPKEGNYFYGMSAHPPLVVDSVQPNTPAERLGLRPGDVIYRVNDEDILGLRPFQEALMKLGDRAFRISVMRDGRVLTFHVRAMLDPEQNHYVLGFIPRRIPFQRVRSRPMEALRRGLSETAWSAGVFFRAVKNMVTGKLSVKTLSGPIGIAKFAGEFLAMGLSWFFKLMAALSVQLGIINLLPIPALDGGHATMILISGVSRTFTGRVLSPRFRETVTLVGAILLIALMIVVVALDILKIFG